MKVIGIIFIVLINLILLPFRLLDYLVIGLPRERKAKKWRANAKVGDKGYFINILGEKTEFTIKRVDKRSKEPFRIESRGFASTCSQSTDLRGCYPL